MRGTILVAGATGNTGRALVRLLRKMGLPVRATARARAGSRGLDGAEVVEVDYSDRASLARAMRGVDRVYLATPLVSDMVALTEQVVAAAVKAGVRHFVKLSGLGVQEPEGLQLGRWHRQAERVVECSGMAWTHLRPNSFMQNFTNNHLGSMRALGLFHDPVGGGRVSYIDVADIAAVAAVALTEPGHDHRVHILTGPEAVSSHEVASLFSRAAGQEIRCVEVSVEAARDAMFGFGLPVAVVDAVAEMYRHMRDGGMAAVMPTVEEITRRPARTFAQFAGEQAALLR